MNKILFGMLFVAGAFSFSKSANLNKDNYADKLKDMRVPASVTSPNTLKHCSEMALFVGASSAYFIEKKDNKQLAELEAKYRGPLQKVCQIEGSVLERYFK